MSNPRTATLAWDYDARHATVDLIDPTSAEIGCVGDFLAEAPWREPGQLGPDEPQEVLGYLAQLLDRLGFAVVAGPGIEWEGLH